MMKDKESYGRMIAVKKSILRRKLMLVEDLIERAKSVPGNVDALDNLRREANDIIDNYNEISDTKLERKHTRKLRIEE